MSVFLDTNAIIYYLHDVRPYSDHVERILKSFREIYTSLRVVDEVIFTLIRLCAWRSLGIKSGYELRQYIARNGYNSFYKEIEMFMKFIDEVGVVVVEDRATLTELIDVATKYRLLPSDALIALTCKHYGVDAIATFDDDFKRVPWLKALP